MAMPDFKERQVENTAKNGKNCYFFQGNQGQLFQFCPEMIEALFLHILDPDYPYFI